MEKYKSRSITYSEIVYVNDWKIKVYTISKEGDFNFPKYYNNALKELPLWLKLKNGFDDNNYKIGFLILHAGKEGLFTLINWWVGENMINSHIYFSEPTDSNHFKRISGSGLGPCIWEQEVINHERMSWIKNILKHEGSPDYKTYLEDVYNGDF